MKKQKGQALVLILLVLAAALALGLTTSRQITTDTKITRQQEESAKAYAAAEAGLEKALAGESVSQIDLGNNTLSVVSNKVVGNQREIIWPVEVPQGQTLIFWLENHDSQGNLAGTYYQKRLNVYWAQTQGSTVPAVIMGLVYRNGRQATYWAWDANASRRGSNKFSSPQVGSFTLNDPTLGESKTFTNKVTLNLASYSQPVFLWLRPLYSAANFGFQGNSNLPAQGQLIISEGQVGPTKAPEITSRRLRAFKTTF